MHIMWELPTNKPNFLWEHTGFQSNYTCRTTKPIIFIHNISLYFHPISSVQDLIEESQMVMSQLFQHGLNFFLSFVVESILLFQNTPFPTWFFSTWGIAQPVFKMAESRVRTNFDELKVFPCSFASDFINWVPNHT